MTVHSPTLPETAETLGELRALLGDRLLTEDSILATYLSDFGRMVERRPAAVARCTSAAEVAEVVRFCRKHRIPLVPRGQAHTQTGQSTTDGGIVIDTALLNTIHEIDAEGLYADCGAGVVWRDLVKTAIDRGLVPPTLTNNLGVTVAGTTSMAGLGVASFRNGSQADNAIEIEVVTGEGEIVVCSHEKNRELFDAVRCTLGQIGIITRIKTRLRPAKPNVRQYSLVYDDLGAFMADAKKVMDGTTFASMGGICSPAPLGFRRIGEGMEPGVGVVGFGHWIFPMFLTIEFGPGEEPDDDRVLAELTPYRHAHTEDSSLFDFCQRMEPMFAIWRRTGYWEHTHPWMETILPWDGAQEYVEMILANLPPAALGLGGHVLLWPSRTDCSEVPYFMHPGGEYVLGWGVLGGMPKEPAHIYQAYLQNLDFASELSIHQFGGKRYLSGYITFDSAERWALHYGDQWEPLKVAKKKYDPDGILAPGFIVWE